MAREDEEGGSLDMLLDTLCNTFGGIILIALLLALSVNKKSVELYDKLVKTDDNKSELIREREQLKNSLLDLKDENIDICVIGEGEVTLEEILRKLINNNGSKLLPQQLDKIDGIAYNHDKFKNTLVLKKESLGINSNARII